MDFSKNLRIKLNPSMKMIAAPMVCGRGSQLEVILSTTPVAAWPCLQAPVAISPGWGRGGGASGEERSRARPSILQCMGQSPIARNDSDPNVTRAKVTKAGSVINKETGEKIALPPAHNCFSSQFWPKTMTSR